jgi:hypothetical protein
MDDHEKARLEYEPARPRRGFWTWVLAHLGRLNRPMSLGMIYVLMFVLGVVGTIIAVAIAMIVRTFQ